MTVILYVAGATDVLKHSTVRSASLGLAQEEAWCFQWWCDPFASSCVGFMCIAYPLSKQCTFNEKSAFFSVQKEYM